MKSVIDGITEALELLDALGDAGRIGTVKTILENCMDQLRNERKEREDNHTGQALTVRNIIKEYLITRGYDGLMENEYYGEMCFCDLDELFYCDGPDHMNCSPAYHFKAAPDCNKCSECSFDFGEGEYDSFASKYEADKNLPCRDAVARRVQ